MASPRRAISPSSPLSSTTLDVSITDLVAEYVALRATWKCSTRGQVKMLRL